VTYRAILDADRDSRRRFSGHGSAIAQAYNHMILPLANARDKRTQVVWGLRDFEHRFGRKAAGLWLPETAADTESLEVLAEQGVGFTILAPAQAARVRPLGDDEWQEVDGGRIDTTMPYRLRLPSGRHIDLFFYDGPVSQAVAFEQLLSSGHDFARRLLERFPKDDDRTRLVHIATDGETYGHHHKFGDMALAWALHHIESNGLARVTNYGEYLALHPPTHEVEIVEASSWSCPHGLGRWREACGCSSGAHPGWSQAWRGPLREALDWLRDTLWAGYERAASRYFEDPCGARDGYIDLILDRSRDSVEAFFERHSRRPLSLTDRARALKLLELQRQALLMFTSCAWFFDEVSGIETVQVLQYAARTIQLAEELFGRPLELAFLERLARAPSNWPEYGDGRAVYERRVLPAKVDLPKVGANFAVGLLFPDGDDAPTGYGFEVRCLERATHRAGRAKLVTGRLAVASRIVPDRAEFEFAFLHFGDHNLSGAVRRFTGRAAHEATSAELRECFSRGDFPGVLRLLEQRFPGSPYSLQTLFRDEQRRILERILESTSRDAEAVHERLYRHHAPLMRFMNSLDTPAPRALQIAAELVLNTRLRHLLEAPDFEPQQLETLLDEIRSIGIGLDHAGLGYAAGETVERAMERFACAPEDLVSLENLKTTIELIRGLPFDVDLRRVENGYYRMLQTLVPAKRERASAGEAAASRWVRAFTELGKTLRVAEP
jgi:hypothetical protein